MSKSGSSIREQAIDYAYMAYRQGADWSVETGVDAVIAVIANAGTRLDYIAERVNLGFGKETNRGLIQRVLDANRDFERYEQED